MLRTASALKRIGVRWAPQNAVWAEPTKKGLQMPLFVLQKILKSLPQCQVVNSMETIWFGVYLNESL